MRNRQRQQQQGGQQGGGGGETFWRGGRRHRAGYAGNEDAHAMFDQGYGGEGEERFRDDELHYDEGSWSGYGRGREDRYEVARDPGYAGGHGQGYGGSIRQSGQGGAGRGAMRTEQPPSGYGGQMRERRGVGGPGQFGREYEARGFEGHGGMDTRAPFGGGGYGGQPRGLDRDDYDDMDPHQRAQYARFGHAERDALGYGGQSGMPFGSWRGQGFSGEQYRGGIGSGNYNSPYMQREPGPHTGKGPRGYARNDERIREDVCERLTDHHDVDATDIEVTVKNGEVTLTGFAKSRIEKQLAEQIADSVGGVKDVHNQIRMQRPEVQQQQAQGTQGQPTTANGSNGRRNDTTTR